MKTPSRSPLYLNPGDGACEVELASLCNMRITLDQDLASWVSRESRRMGLSSSAFISTLLEWARNEDIVPDEDVGVFQPALRPGLALDAA